MNVIVGFLAAIGVVVVVIAIWSVIVSMPGMNRYLKIRSM